MPALRITRHAESVVGVAKIGWDAGAGRAPACLDVMAPGPAAGRASIAALRSLRVAFRGFGVVVHLKPIAAPLVHVLADIVKAKRVRSVLCHRLGAFLPTLLIVGQ